MMRSRSRTSARRPEISACTCMPASFSSTACSAGSEFSSTSRRAAPKIEDALADFRADRAAAAGDHDRLAGDELLKPPVIDLDARAQQQVLDRDRRELHRRPAGIERRQLAQIKAELARADQDRFRPRFRRQRRRRQHRRITRLPLIAKIGDDALEIVDVAQHRNAADRLAAVVRRRREDADRPDLLHRAALDRAQQDLGVGGAAEDRASASRRRSWRAAACACSGNSDRRCASRPGRTSAGTSTAGS